MIRTMYSLYVIVVELLVLCLTENPKKNKRLANFVVLKDEHDL